MVPLHGQPLEWILLVLGLIGALDALYFVLVSYRLMAPDARFIPSVCAMDEGSCRKIIATRWAKVLGLPNGVYGLAWYGLVMAVAIAAMFAWHPIPQSALIAAAAATVAFSALLFWALLVRLKTRCPLCFLGHAINVLILVYLSLVPP